MVVMLNQLNSTSEFISLQKKKGTWYNKYSILVFKLKFYKHFLAYNYDLLWINLFYKKVLLKAKSHSKFISSSLIKSPKNKNA